MSNKYEPKHSSGLYDTASEVSTYLSATNNIFPPLAGKHRTSTSNETVWVRLAWELYKSRNKENFNE